jgi:hypothetical protein
VRWCRRKPVDTSALDQITRKLTRLTSKYQSLTREKGTMTAPDPQANINADVAALTASFTTLDGVFTDLQTELAALPASVDTSALDALVQSGAAEVAKFQGLDTINPPAAS